jgi:Putative beta-barrel porin-2, OmpL-like. bbp2
MSEKRVERNSPSWAPMAAFACFAASVISLALGFALTTNWVLNANLHPVLHSVGLTLLIIGIPLLILGGHCLDLMERRAKRSRSQVDAHENSRTKPLPVLVMLVGSLLVLQVASTKLRAQQATAVERGHSINALNTSAQARFGDVGQAVSEDPPSAASQVEWQYGGFIDLGYLLDFNHPANRLFRSRGTTFHVDRVNLNMAGVYARKKATEKSRWGVELTAHAGKDSELFGFSATAPNIGGFKFLRHLGPTNVSYLAPAGKGLALQAGIFTSFIGYDSLYAKDNFNYTRPWGADFTPYLMMGVNASYPISEKLTGSVFVVNGYWHLARANNVPNSGGQLAYKINPRVTLKQTALLGPHQANKSFKFWRFLSDTILERKVNSFALAFEYTASWERVDAAGNPTALMMSGQLPARWTMNKNWSISVRPEVFWDRDGRWTLARQTVKALTSTVEYRTAYRWSNTIMRLEHRWDDSRGREGGFFRGREISPGEVGLTPSQHLLIFGLIFTMDH